MTNRRAPKSVVVLISGAGTTMKALERAAREPAYGARIAAVISDQPQAPGLDIAREASVPTAVVDLHDFDSRDQWDHALARTIESFAPDMVVLAGFMKIVGAAVLEVCGGKMVNTHPALLPSFPGAHAVADALAAGVKVSGCSVIIVDEGVDTGPIVAQAAVEVRDNDTEQSLHERIKSVERELVVATVGTMLRQGWQVNGRVVTMGKGDTRE